MPSRWLSRRGRPQHNPANTNAEKKPNFDFAFSTNPPTALPQRRESVEVPRPTTAGGYIEERIKKLRLDVQSIRPRTSDCHKPSPFDTTQPASKSEDDLIGLALGSPTHPPTAFRSMASELSGTASEPPLKRRGTFSDKSRRLQPKHWNKIGALFRTRSMPRRKDPSTTASPLIKERAAMNKSTETLSKVQWFKPWTPVPEQPSRAPPPVPPLDATYSLTDDKVVVDQAEKLVSACEPSPIPEPPPIPETETEGEVIRPVRSSSLRRPHRSTSLPRLEIDIPNPPLDRYSILFKDFPVASTSSSSLLARRSRVLGSLKSTRSSRKDSNSETEEFAIELAPPEGPDQLNQPIPPRRLTTPTMARPPAPFAGLITSSSSPTVSKYSLFPISTPASAKAVGRLPSGEAQRRRSATSPACLSPMQDKFPTDAPRPLNPRREVFAGYPVGSPDEVTASTERSGAWSSAHSLKSSVSSSTTMEEIFFDIKSFRDSKGMEDGHFVMTRPDSTAVQLARTRSKLNGTSRSRRRLSPSLEGKAASVATPVPTIELDGKHLSTRSVNTVFEEVIAAVERLAMPNGETIQPTEVGEELNEDSICQCSDTSGEPWALEHESESAATPILCPATESPLGKLSDSTLPNEASPPIPRIAAVKIPDRLIEESPTIPQGPPTRNISTRPEVANKPPPVPKKDAKYIPISKFAAKDTVSNVERAGIRPTRPTRAATETDMSASLQRANHSQHHSKSSVRMKPERSATHPLPQAVSGNDLVSKASPASAQKAKVGCSDGQTPGPGITTITAIIRPIPTAEVSVARSVSLTRKQSARVLVPGPKLLARRAQAMEQEKEMADRDLPITIEVDDEAEEKIVEIKKENTEEVEKKLVKEKKALSPVVVEAQKGHKPGTSMNLVVETA